MTEDEKLVLANIMVGMAQANLEQSYLVLEVTRAAKGHVPDELLRKLLGSTKSVRHNYDELKSFVMGEGTSDPKQTH